VIGSFLDWSSFGWFVIVVMIGTIVVLALREPRR